MWGLIWLISTVFCYILLVPLRESDIIPENIRMNLCLQSIPLIMLITSLTIIKIKHIKFNYVVKLPSIKKVALLILVFILSFFVIKSYYFWVNLLSEAKLTILILSLFEENLFSFKYLSILIISPIAEELFYRKIMFSKLIEYYSLPISLLITSLLFSLIHADLQNFIPLFFFGVIAGYIYYITRSVIICILFHFVYNLLVTYFYPFKEDFSYSAFVLSLGVFFFVYLSFYWGLRELKNIFENNKTLEGSNRSTKPPDLA